MKLRNIVHAVGLSMLFAVSVTLGYVYLKIWLYGFAYCIEPNVAILSFEFFVMVPVALAYLLYLMYDRVKREKF